MPLSIVAACLLTMWLGWRGQLSLGAALKALGAGLALIVLYVVAALGLGLLGPGPSYPIAEVLKVERLLPGSFFVVIGYLVCSYAAAASVRGLRSRSGPSAAESARGV